MSLELPSALVAGRGDGIDSAAGVFEGAGVSVVVDQGPFSDPLTTHAGRPEHRDEAIDVAGTAARLVSFRDPEDRTYSVGAHVPGPSPVTVVVRADASVPEHVPRDIVESLRLLD